MQIIMVKCGLHTNNVPHLDLLHLDLMDGWNGIKSSIPENFW